MILVAQVSDTHFDHDARNTERAERVMAYLADLRHRPEAILVTGDIADAGLPEQYAEARTALQADIPVLAIPGNHDEREPFREILLDEPSSNAPINLVHRIDGLTIALLDSSVPGEAGGKLGQETYRWLADILAETPADDAVLLALHHPPVCLHSPVVDGIALAEAEHFAEVVSAEPRILAVLTGHAHSAAMSSFAGRPLLVAPSTASVLGGEWEVALPDRIMDYAPEPSIALHAIDNNRITTHFRSVPLGGWVTTPT